MMSDITWTMNCVLFGAKVIGLIKQGKKQEAIEEIRNLSSEFDQNYAEYLVMRLEQVKS